MLELLTCSSTASNIRDVLCYRNSKVHDDHIRWFTSPDPDEVRLRILTRFILLCFLATARQVHFLCEQPGNSSMPHFPYWIFMEMMIAPIKWTSVRLLEPQIFIYLDLYILVFRDYKSSLNTKSYGCIRPCKREANSPMGDGVGVQVSLLIYINLHPYIYAGQGRFSSPCAVRWRRKTKGGFRPTRPKRSMQWWQKSAGKMVHGLCHSLNDQFSYHACSRISKFSLKLILACHLVHSGQDQQAWRDPLNTQFVFAAKLPLNKLSGLLLD